VDQLLVMKFGGTSMGSADRIRVAASLIVGQAKRRPCVTVVSAMSGITDLLLSALKKAETGDQAAVDQAVTEFRTRHQACVDELLLGDARQQATEVVSHWASEFERSARGVLMLKERPPRAVDYVAAIGEQVSARLLAAYLAANQHPAEAVSGTELIVTDSVFGDASPLLDRTRTKAQARLHALLQQKHLPIVTGFNGATEQGEATTLGRGGSDFSGSILAAALDASEFYIWTDVDGIMSADPRLVKDARVLDEVSYAEAAELAYNGAKVLHPRTLAPLAERQIPVWSKNSFAPAKAGTKITAKPPLALGAKAVTSMGKVALISVEPANSAVNGTALMGRALEALGNSNAEVLLVSSSSYRQAFCFLVRSDEVPEALRSLREQLSLELAHGYIRPIEVDENVGLVAIVGEGMRGVTGLAGRIFTAISRENVNIIAIAQGSSENTIGVIVRRDGVDTAVRAIHSECHLGGPRDS
jgi:bifunctional aspartokinase / homoserine dehydrogenase 1